MWTGLIRFLFEPKEKRSYIWLILGPLEMSLASFSLLSQASSTQVILFFMSLTLSWVLFLLFALESRSRSYRLFDLEEEVFRLEAEVDRLQERLLAREEEITDIEARHCREIDDLREEIEGRKN